MRSETGTGARLVLVDCLDLADLGGQQDGWDREAGARPGSHTGGLEVGGGAWAGGVFSCTLGLVCLVLGCGGGSV
jgi:hypothetical protein